jgi:hypothetical protein
MVPAIPAKLNELARLFGFKDANLRDHVLNWINAHKLVEVAHHPILIPYNLPLFAGANISLDTPCPTNHPVHSQVKQVPARG